MNADLDALATRLYVPIDDLLNDHPDRRPERPAIGIATQLTDAELVTPAVIQALLGYTSERRFIRYAHLDERSEELDLTHFFADTALCACVRGESRHRRVAQRGSVPPPASRRPRWRKSANAR